MKLACRSDGEWDNKVVMVTSDGSCSTGKVEGVGTVELVCVGRRLRMGGESGPLPVWRSVGGGLTGKGELHAWVVWAVI